MSGKQSFFKVLGAEFKRVFGRPKALLFSLLFAVCAFGMFVGMVLLANFAMEEMGAGSMTEFIGFSTPVSILSLCFGIWAAAFSARDYNDGTLLASLLTVPKRGRLFLARMIPWIIVPVIFSALALGACCAFSMSTITDTTLALKQAGLSLASMVAYTVLGFCCGTITKKGAPAVFLYLGLTMLLPMVLATAGLFVPDMIAKIIEWINTALPGNAFERMVGVATGTEGSFVACMVTVAWTVILPIISYILFKVRATLKI